ncbi:unnamed protein product [Urochloa decumbens]|uniref:PGG domain-containing protein n=1 Tax=Urochloa decumbens TaxID=240449 RepID=A0ABC9B3N9_9POAL
MQPPNNTVNPEQPTNQSDHQTRPQGAETRSRISEVYEYLLFLGILVVTITFTAALDPPGGLWQETKDGHRTGDPIMPDTRRGLYTVFYIFNLSAFVGSLLLVYVLLVAGRQVARGLNALKFVRLVDLALLVVAFIAGSSRGHRITLYALVQCACIIAVIVLVQVLSKWLPKNSMEVIPDEFEEDHRKHLCKVVMLLAIFGAIISYTASLSPPGSFWEHPEAGEAKHRAGDPILLERHLGRLVVFFVFNTLAFAMSVAILVLLPCSNLTKSTTATIVVVMLGLVIAYIAGVWSHYSRSGIIISISCLIVDIIVYIISYKAFDKWWPSSETTAPQENKSRELILLLAVMVATVTYQAGLQPPGGAWRETGGGHSGGGLILLATHAARYKLFFFFNSAAFVTSIVVVIIVQLRSQIGQQALEAAVILDLLGLMGAYAAGSIRHHHMWTPMCVFIVVAAVFIFICLVASLVYQRWLDSQDGGGGESTKELEIRRDVLMLLAIMAITISYQAGLTPPGKFWLEQGDGSEHHAGDPVLADTYPGMYKLFFVFNTATFMISVALILLLVSRKLRSISTRNWRVLSGYTLLVLILLMATFVAGSNRRLPKVTAAGLAVAAAVLVWLGIVLRKEKDAVLGELRRFFSAHQDNNGDHGHANRNSKYIIREYLVVVSIMAASVTYQAGLVPPGGAWPSDGPGHAAAGNPVLRDTDRRRYLAFSYCNSASFAASIVVNVLLLLDAIWPKRFPLSTRATYMVLVADVLSLLLAYAIGSSRDRDWGSWVYVLAMAAIILVYIAVYMMMVASPAPPRESQQGHAGRVDVIGSPAPARESA